MTTFFIDTNVILYTRDRRFPEKRERAQMWLSALAERRLPKINLQVINEYCHVALRKLPFLSDQELRSDAEQLRLWGETPLDFETLTLAWRYREATGYAWFDCTLLSAAQRLGCSVFVSEDMQHGRAIDNLTIINPFIALPGDFQLRD